MVFIYLKELLTEIFMLTAVQIVFTPEWETNIGIRKV